MIDNDEQNDYDDDDNNKNDYDNDDNVHRMVQALVAENMNRA